MLLLPFPNQLAAARCKGLWFCGGSLAENPDQAEISKKVRIISDCPEVELYESRVTIR
jgi:hypothetical protein